MKKSIKNISKLLALGAIMMLSVHTAASLSMYCVNSTACLGAVYFGIPDNSINLPVADTSNALTTNSINTEVGIKFSDLSTVVQVVGLLALLIGVSVMVVLEFLELKILRRRSRA